MWCSTYFCCFDHWSRTCRSWWCRDILRCYRVRILEVLISGPCFETCVGRCGLHALPLYAFLKMALLMVKVQSSIIAYAVPLIKRPIYTGIIGGMYGLVGLSPSVLPHTPAICGARVLAAHLITPIPARRYSLLTGKSFQASVAGPLMGGAFTDKVSWRWCFYINLPIGAVTIVGIAFFFTSPPRENENPIGFWERAKQFDPVGTAIFMPCIVCLLLALQWGGSKYHWGDGEISHSRVFLRT